MNIAIHRYIIESTPPSTIKSSSSSNAFSPNIIVKKSSITALKTKDTKYHKTEKQNENAANKYIVEPKNNTGLNKYMHKYQNGIKQPIEIIKFLIFGDREFMSEIKLMI